MFIVMKLHILIDFQNLNGLNKKTDKEKENNIMGLTAKPVSKMKSIMRKMENQLEAERKASKEKKEAKKSKTNISK